MNQFPPSPIRAVSNLLKILLLKVHHQYCCHRFQQHQQYWWQFNDSVADTGGKFFIGVGDTGGKFAAGVIENAFSIL